MAKWGEGDPRWIVEERPDSTNVNNWHWTEKNCFPWADNYLRTSLKDLSAEGNGFKANVSEISTLEGETTVGNRKGKVYFIYELNMTLKWKGDSDIASAEGKITISDITQDDEVDEYKYSVTCVDETQDTKPIKNFVNKDLLKKIQKVLENLKTAIKEEHTKAVILPTLSQNGKTETSQQGSTQKQSSTTQTTSTQEKKSSEKVPTKKITMKIELLASAQDIFETLLNPQRVQIWTQEKPDIAPEVGRKFSFFGGNVTGEIVNLVPNKKIEEKWRLKNWPEGHFSHVTLELDQGSNSTEVHLTQTGVPAEDAEGTERNWHNFYWNRIKGIFGWGVMENF